MKRAKPRRHHDANRKIVCRHICRRLTINRKNPIALSKHRVKYCTTHDNNIVSKEEMPENLHRTTSQHLPFFNAQRKIKHLSFWFNWEYFFPPFFFLCVCASSCNFTKFNRCVFDLVLIMRCSAYNLNGWIFRANMYVHCACILKCRWNQHLAHVLSRWRHLDNRRHHHDAYLSFQWNGQRCYVSSV